MAKVFSPEAAALAGPRREAEQAAARELLARLVAHDTTSWRPNRALIDEVSSYLGSLGVDAIVVENEQGGRDGKAGLIASIGPEVEGGVVLSGHTDVVPVTGQTWSGDPFRLAAREGRLFGRGTADMKGFLAAALALVPWFRALPLRRPIHLVFSWDEEVGCLGAPALIGTLLARRPRPALVIVGEPTGMQPADRHRGITTHVTTVNGVGGHSSAPDQGVNAIGLAARFVVEVERRAQDIARRNCDSQNGSAPEYTTLNVGQIEGGSAINMIAEHCRVSWECRPGCGDDDDVFADLERFVVSELMPGLGGQAPRVSITTETLASVPPLTPQPDSPATALLRRLTGRNTCVAAPFTSEAGLFQQAGIPAVLCGPGWPREAHQPDEFLEESQLDACLDLLRGVADWSC